MTYHWRHSKVRETKATNIKNRVSIHEHLAEMDGKRFGVWEIDLIIDSNSNAILTVIERSANFLLMAKTWRERSLCPLQRLYGGFYYHIKETI